MQRTRAGTRPCEFTGNLPPSAGRRSSTWSRASLPQGSSAREVPAAECHMRGAGGSESRIFKSTSRVGPSPRRWILKRPAEAPMTIDDFSRFENLTFEQFRRLALDARLSKYEKIGFPDSYREGLEALIFEDIRSKLTNL